jgi:hypothetical protein
MGDITNPRLLYLKGGLFVLTGLVASGLLLVECPRPEAVLLLAIAVWCFARAYYFAFYVVQHYVDPGFRFAGLWDFAKYAWRRRRSVPQPPEDWATGQMMTVGGYSRRVVDPRYGLLELSEVSFAVPPADLRRVAAFLVACADRIDAGDWPHDHAHLPGLLGEVEIVVSHPPRIR